MKQDTVKEWEHGCYERTGDAWLGLRGAYNARDLGGKIVYLEQMIAQARSWLDLLKTGKGEA